MKVEHIFYTLCDRILVSRNKTRFWEDVWHNNKTMAKVFPMLYNLTFSKNAKVDKVVATKGACLVFKGVCGGFGWFFPGVEVINKVVLQEGDDKVGWKLGKKGFTVKTLYNAFANQTTNKKF